MSYELLDSVIKESTNLEELVEETEETEDTSSKNELDEMVEMLKEADDETKYEGTEAGTEKNKENEEEDQEELGLDNAEEFGKKENPETDMSTPAEEMNEDADIFSEADEMISEAIRECLRDTILESEEDAEVKIEQLKIVEEAEFDETQMVTFMENVIHPIMILSDSFNPNVLKRVSIPVELWETVHVINDVTERRKNPGLYESVFGAKASKQFLSEEISEIFESYGYEDEEDKKELVELAASIIKEGIDLDQLEPSIIDITEAVLVYNELYELGFVEESIYEILEAEDGKVRAFMKRVKGAGEKAWGGTKTAGSAIYGTAKKGAETAVGKVKANKKTTATAAAAVILTGALVYKKLKNRQCSGLTGDDKNKCMRNAIKAAIAAEKSRMSSCNTTKNPDKCKSKISKSISTWEAKMKKYY